MADDREPDWQWEEGKAKAAISRNAVMSDEEKSAAHEGIAKEWAENKARWEKKSRERALNELDERTLMIEQLENDDDQNLKDRLDRMSDSVSQIKKDNAEKIAKAEQALRDDYAAEMVRAQSSKKSVQLEMDISAVTADEKTLDSTIRDVSVVEFIEEDQNFIVSINENLVANQAFKQTLENLSNVAKQTKILTVGNNYLGANNKKLQSDALEFLDNLESGLTEVINRIDISDDPVPINKDPRVIQWINEKWPELGVEFNKIANRSKMTEILVKTGFPAAFALVGVGVGFIFGVPLVHSAGAGGFFGMWVSGQVSTKEVGNRVQDSMGESNDSG